MKAEQIYNVLMSEDFDFWYRTEFQKHVEDSGSVPKDEILQDIARKFNVRKDN